MKNTQIARSIGISLMIFAALGCEKHVSSGGSSDGPRSAASGAPGTAAAPGAEGDRANPGDAGEETGPGAVTSPSPGISPLPASSPSPLPSPLPSAELPLTGVSLMASLGDSITAASLADTSATSPHPFSTLEGFLQSRFTDGLYSPYVNRHENLSWASGDGISQKTLLRSYVQDTNVGADVEALNFAVPGSLSLAMPGQAQQVVDAMATGKYSSLAYVTLFAGANDACATAVDDLGADDRMRDALRDAFARLSSVKQARKIRVAVVGVPPVADLGGSEVADYHVYWFLSCRKIQLKYFHYCNTLLGWTTPDQYAAATDAVKRKNLVLQAAVKEANVLHPELEAYYSPVLTERALKPQDLAIDCFHPNQGAQADIARRIWNDLPWFKRP